MYGSLSPQEIEQVLYRQVLGRIGCHADDTTYIVPINFAYDGEFVYCYTQPGMKINLMRSNPRVCFQTDMIENMANWQSVVLWGRFEELTEDGDRQVALKKLRAHVMPLATSERIRQSRDWPFNDDHDGVVKGIVFRIRITQKTGRYERSLQSAPIA
ncbi:MAG: pyridoxamine 5'-phosphate oxidase family protein [Niastella sp.]|nr:pyridoxamine 5'-phosphate oxidase family protein [Niastella sp.]